MNENIVLNAGKGFEFMGNNGHTMLISKALYGTKTSGARWREKSSETLHQLGFSPLKSDHELWMKHEGDYFSYICVYVDDLIHAGKKVKELFAILEKMK